MGDRDDLNELLNEAVEVATDLLTADTEFLPFALAMQATDGEIFQIELDEETDQPDPEIIIAALRGGLTEAARAGRWRAVAVVADVTAEDEDGVAVTSAIKIWLEHADGEPVDCTIGYSIGEEAVELDELVAEPGEAVVFAPAVPPN
jgi:hypothetical protein